MVGNSPARSSVKMNLLAAAATAFMVTTVILSGSRSGWIGIVCVGLLGGTALLLSKQHQKGQEKTHIQKGASPSFFHFQQFFRHFWLLF